MRKLAVALLPLLPALLAHAATWEKIGTNDRVTTYNRTRAGSSVKEVKAVGTIDAPPWVCKNVVDDVAHYKDFMPYTADSRLLARENNTVLSYQRVDAPLISDRDYTILIRDLSHRLPNGDIIYKSAWTSANQRGPKKISGVVRVGINEGYWLFEPLAGGNKTRATYYLYTDPGGALPAFVVNKANTSTIPDLFNAIRKQARKAQYRKTKPRLPAGPPPSPPATVKPAPSGTRPQ